MAHKTRPRMLYPGLFDSPKFLLLSDPAFRTWAWLLSHADDEGRGPHHLALIQTRPSPGSPRTREEAVSICKELEDAELVRFFSEAEREWYSMHDWADFQRIRPDRVKPSTVPEPNGDAGDDVEALVLKLRRGVRELDGGALLRPLHRDTLAIGRLLQQTSPEEVGELIDFALADEFWQGVIVDAGSLERNAGKLRAASRRPPAMSKTERAAEEFLKGEQ